MKRPAHEERLAKDPRVALGGRFAADLYRLLDSTQRMREVLEALAAEPDDVLPPDAYDQAIQTRDLARQTLADLKRATRLCDQPNCSLLLGHEGVCPPTPHPLEPITRADFAVEGVSRKRKR